MAVKKLLIEEFLKLAATLPVFDVRSPGEYNHAQIPGAISLPLFSDEERKVVGTLYKEEGKQRAIKEGLDFFGPKMRPMVEQVEQASGKTQKDNKSILVHCWRGGMRSGAVAWLLDLYGFEVYTLAGGYKAYRNHVLQYFEKEYDFTLLGGYTGSGKTAILHELKRKEQHTIDLEGLASHKGSAFGGIGLLPQPSQEMFENRLAAELHKNQTVHFFLEDESQRIGVLHIPHELWKTMRKKNISFLDLPFEVRLQNIVREYGQCDKEKLKISIERIQKRLGPLETKTALALLQQNEIGGCFAILLRYYDKVYNKALLNRENVEGLLNKITCFSVDTLSNTEKLLLCSSAKL
ncbi:MAG: tRNA 2-selenouridine(34) synthase MnmH [Rhizobacter sp.]|nr:tRNA 2-selenouridine(34) synthase MnmH [Ferruginibacter sp.]